jgi:hypothetical protein
MDSMRLTANLVHDCNSCILALLVQLHHSRGHIASSNHMLLQPNTTLDDSGVKDVSAKAKPSAFRQSIFSRTFLRNERNHQIVLGDLSVQGFLVGNIKRDSTGELDTFCKPLSASKGSAGFGGSVISCGTEEYASNSPTDTSMPESERMSRVGLLQN